MISTRPAMEKEVFMKLLKSTKIIEIHPLFGEYDMIAKIEAEYYNEIGKFVIENIRTIDGVLNTQTLMAITF